jgi:hypothetical protein
MLFHVPIVILTTLAPIPVADNVPTLNIEKECRFEGGSSDVFDRCMRDENDARKEIEALWPKVGSADRTACVSEATTGGYASYIELVICLEMARDVAKLENRSAAPGPGSQPDETVGERDR